MTLCSLLKVTPDYFLLGIDRTENEDEWLDIQDKLQLCTKEQRRFFSHLLEAVVAENQSVN